MVVVRIVSAETYLQEREKMSDEKFQVLDDGTMDTVICDTSTGKEYRFVYDGFGPCPEHDDEKCQLANCEFERYDMFVDWCIEEAADAVDGDAAWLELLRTN